MDTKKTSVLSLVLILPVLIIFMSYHVIMRQNPERGFTRNIQAGLLRKINQINFDETLISICGISSNSIFFSTTDPSKIIITSKDLKYKNHILLNLKHDRRIEDAFNITVDSPNLLLFAGNIPTIIKCHLKDSSVIPVKQMKGRIFSNGISCNPGSYIVRRSDEWTKDLLFTKVDQSGDTLAIEQGISKITHDEGMSTQGTLLYESSSNRIIYVYKLFNIILCLDTNLNLIYKSHTIDTIGTALMNFRKYKEKGRVLGSSAAPLYYTNIGACVTKKHILINSLVKADNENLFISQNSPVIDVYNIDSGNYEYSFYIPGIEGEKLSSFSVKDTTLVAVFGMGKNISTYSIKAL